MVARVANPVDHRVAHVEVRARHVDAQPQHVRAVSELARAHPPQQVEILVDAAVAIRSRRAGLRQRSTRPANLVGRLAVDIREALGDEPLREFVQDIVVVRRVIAMRAPVVAEPAHRRRDRILVLDVLLQWIGVVETKMARPAIFRGKAEIQDDRLRVTVMQIAVGLGRKARDHAAAIRRIRVVVGDDRAQEIGARGRRRGRGSGHAARVRSGSVGNPFGHRMAVRIPQCNMIRFVHEQAAKELDSNRGGQMRHRPSY
jgi:hypothetical protein